MTHKSEGTLSLVRAATRPILFHTDFPETPFATHGGTLVLVLHNQHVFAVTCGHTLGSFSWARLMIPQRRVSGPIAALDSVIKFSSPIDHAIGSDLMDLIAIRVAEHPNWFEDQPIALDKDSVADCVEGDILTVCGYPADISNWAADTPLVGTFDFRIRADRRQSNDIVLRSGHGNIAKAQLDLQSLSGLSGSPVLREADGKLCGIVVRGGLDKNGDVQVFFVEASDVLEIIASATGDKGFHRYDKEIPVEDLPFPVSVTK